MVVVGLVIMLEAVLFSAVLCEKQSDPKNATTIEMAKRDTADYMTKYNVKLTDFNSSVMGSGSQMLTLSMNLEIQLGRTKTEIQDDKKPSDEDMKKFQEAVEALLPSVRILLIEKVSAMDAALLAKPEGMNMITAAVKDFINEKLEMLSLELEDPTLDRNRVQTINIETFILQ